MKTKLALAVILAALAVPPEASTQSLTPLGSPGPIFKTLDQVKPGTPISSLPFTILTPGFYYLVKDVSGATGINATVSNVTIDLNGFTVTGPGAGAGGTAAGIVGVNDTVIRNGRVTAWPGDGVRVGAAVVLENLDVVNCGNNGLTTGEQARIASCRVGAASKKGMSVGDSSVIEGCMSLGNSSTITSSGIQLGSYCTLSNSVSSFNSGPGIVVGDNCVISKCSAAHNSNGQGISTGDHCVVQSCDASSNILAEGILLGKASLAEHCVIAGGSAQGIFMFDDSTAQDCTVVGTGSGIYLQGDRCRVVGCAVNGCTNAAAGAIYVSGTGNLIERNHIRGNSGAGILVFSGSKNVIIRNEAGDNNPSYSIPAGTANVGPIGPPESVSSPFANLLN